MMERGVMPKELVRKSGNDGWADLLVQWGPDELGADGNPKVRLFVANSEAASRGSFMFHPADPATMGLNDGDAIGPVYVLLDRDGLNRLIRVARRARDATFGRDE